MPSSEVGICKRSFDRAARNHGLESYLKLSTVPLACGLMLLVLTLSIFRKSPTSVKSFDLKLIAQDLEWCTKAANKLIYNDFH